MSQLLLLLNRSLSKDRASYLLQPGQRKITETWYATADCVTDDGISFIDPDKEPTDSGYFLYPQIGDVWKGADFTTNIPQPPDPESESESSSAEEPTPTEPDYTKSYICTAISLSDELPSNLFIEDQSFQVVKVTLTFELDLLFNTQVLATDPPVQWDYSFSTGSTHEYKIENGLFYQDKRVPQLGTSDFSFQVPELTLQCSATISGNSIADISTYLAKCVQYRGCVNTDTMLEWNFPRGTVLYEGFQFHRTIGYMPNTVYNYEISLSFKVLPGVVDLTSIQASNTYAHWLFDWNAVYHNRQPVIDPNTNQPLVWQNVYPDRYSYIDIFVYVSNPDYDSEDPLSPPTIPLLIPVDSAVSDPSQYDTIPNPIDPTTKYVVYADKKDKLNTPIYCGEIPGTDPVYGQAGWDFVTTRLRPNIGEEQSTPLGPNDYLYRYVDLRELFLNYIPVGVSNG